MQVTGGVVTKFFQLGAIQKVERLQQRRSLAPRTAGEQPDIAKRSFDWALDARAIVRQIVGRQ